MGDDAMMYIDRYRLPTKEKSAAEEEDGGQWAMKPYRSLLIHPGQMIQRGHPTFNSSSKWGEEKRAEEYKPGPHTKCIDGLYVFSLRQTFVSR